MQLQWRARRKGGGITRTYIDGDQDGDYTLHPSHPALGSSTTHRSLRAHIGSIQTSSLDSPYPYSPTISSPGSCVDDQIWRALTAVHIADVIREKGGLDAEMSDNTLSHGEKQLFCLARAILRDCKIVVLDEATSKYILLTLPGGSS